MNVTIVEQSAKLLWITPNAAQNIEISGRVCYKSEDRITDDSADKFVKMISDRGHESVIEHASASMFLTTDRGCCYTDDTKVLTEEGFKYFFDVKKGEKIYTLDEKDNLVLVDYNSLIKKKHNGEIYNFKSTQIDLAVTSNHNMWIFDYDKRSPISRIWKFEKAENLKNKRYKFLKGINKYSGKKMEFIKIPSVPTSRGFYDEKFSELKLDSGKFLNLLGLWVTDGCVSFGKNGSGNRIVISQVKEKTRKVIESLLIDLNLPYTKMEKEFRINSPQLFKWLVSNFIKDSDCRKSYYLKLPKWLKNLDTDLLKSFIDGCVQGDGCYCSDGREMIYTISSDFADDLVELYLKTGRCANKNINRVGGVKQERKDKLEIYGSKTCYVVNAVNTKEHTWRKTVKNYNVFDYDEYVYCLELKKHHKLYVMRNGKSCWCGNSHELVRHRLASYSQESTRYVNYNKRFGLQVVKPLGMTPVQEECWMDAMQTAANRYEEICAIQNCPAEVARDILPTCTKADIVVTANFREWKHIIRLRTSPKAHPKIRQLIGYVENTLIKECPAVFGKEKHAF